MSNARLFSTVDIRSAYWHVLLDEQPFLLLTEDIAGSVCLLVATYVSSDISQKKLFKCLDGLTGIHRVADDIMITGRGETENDVLIDYMTIT